jgi:hypothetical protein
VSGDSFDLITWFHEGGWPMYLLVLLGLEGMTVGALHIAFAQRWTRILAGSALASILIFGAFGTWLGRTRTEEALRAVDPAMAAQLREVGEREASRPIEFAVVLAGLTLVPFVVGELRKKTATPPA